MAGMHEQEISEEYIAREQARRLRLRLGLRWFAAVLLIAMLLGMMLGRLVNGPAEVPAFLLGTVELRQVHGEPLADGLRLRVQFDRQTPVQLQRQAELVRLSFPEVQLHSEQRAGREQGVGWRLVEGEQGVQLVLLGLREAPEVTLSNYYDLGRWYLQVDARLAKSAQ